MTTVTGFCESCHYRLKLTKTSYAPLRGLDYKAARIEEVMVLILARWGSADNRAETTVLLGFCEARLAATASTISEASFR
ncbi:hypothetical protein D3C78_1612080 [compost metagenome]